jgi:ubiquinone biosynthesis protein UbiJ
VITDLLESIGNRLLRLDPDALQRFQELEGKVICLELVGIDRRLYLSPGETGIKIREVSEQEPDVTLSGSPIAFTQLGLRGLHVTLLREGKLEIKGDVELGQSLQRFVEEVDIDWEELLSRYIGDVAAHQTGNLVRGFNDWGQNAYHTGERNVSEYLQEEAGLLASASSVARYTNAVDELRSAVDRLEQRVQRLQALLS